MCCLSYEIDHYTETGKKLPKVGAEVRSPEGKAIVVSLNYLKEEVRVKIDDKAGGWIFKDFKASELSFKCNCPNQKNQNDKSKEEDEKALAYLED
jgi:cell fate regulator YaaT (PSP1 superfamily)